MTSGVATGLPPAVIDAVASVPDPEYPGVSIVDLGLFEGGTAEPTPSGLAVTVDLIPTYAGCPALAMIAGDVEEAVRRVDGVASCEVRWKASPVWSVERVAPGARARLRDDFTVVLRRKDGGLRCPVCGADDVADRSLAGPTRCRSVAWCASCRNVVEVMR